MARMRVSGVVMNIMIAGDDHGCKIFQSAYDDAKKRFGTIDMFIHTGDSEGFDCEYYKSICGCPVYMVRGNNDFNELPGECVINAGLKKIFVTHGHRYRVYFDSQTIAYAGRERDADIVVFGHTHHALHQVGGDIELINPGSVAGIRSYVKTYAMLQIEGSKTQVDIINI